MVMMHPEKTTDFWHKSVSYGLEAGDALGLEDLHGVGLELIVAGEALVQADHTLRLLVGHRAHHFQGQCTLQTDEERTTCHAIHGLAGQRLRLDRCGERETALEQDFVKQVVRRPALAYVIDVQLELPA